MNNKIKIVVEGVEIEVTGSVRIGYGRKNYTCHYCNTTIKKLKDIVISTTISRLSISTIRHHLECYPKDKGIP